MAQPSNTPIPLRRCITAEGLCQSDPCDALHVLGSFWPNSRTSFESHLAKTFKESSPVSAFLPHISHLCEFYADLILKTTGGGFHWIARVLSSRETQPERSRPQSLLVDALCMRTGARDITHVFSKTAARSPMRTVPHLSGPGAIRSRLNYVLQDLCIRPARLGGTVLLVDDIMNTGASVRVYGWALKDLAGVERVTAVNLAATRFARGKDGRGMLRIDRSGLERWSGLSECWLDSVGVFHIDSSCACIRPPVCVGVRFAAERRSGACSRCVAGRGHRVV